MAKKWIRGIILITVTGLMALIALPWFLLRPVPLERSEIFHGVFLSVEEIPKTEHGSGRAMILEVHWDTPGVSFANRPFDFPIDPQNPLIPHYRLALADQALRSTGASVLVNTTIYQPDSLKDLLSWPPVRSNETLVIDGIPSHYHEYSYLMYWDAEGKAHMSKTTKDLRESVEQAVTGIGLQGVQVRDGVPAYHAIDQKEELFARTFIGVDPLRNILYLMAFEKASAYLMIDRALEYGVIFGGQVDSGKSTNLLIGKHARGIRSHTGIRGVRPLGPYLTVQADPL